MISKTNQIELHQLRYFRALAEELHYHKAADKLHISQSALSQQIKLLEQQLGVSLFDRLNKKISLSDPGELFYAEAIHILQQVERSMERLDQFHTGSAGTLKIGFVASAMSSFLPEAIKNFHTAYPAIHLRFEEMNNFEQLPALENGDIDIGFMRSNQVRDQMHILRVFEETFTLILPRNHRFGNYHFKDLSILKDEDFILFPNAKSEFYFQQIINLCSDSGFYPRITHQAIHGPTIFSLVGCGMGISIIPTSLAQLHTEDVIAIELKSIPQRTQIFAVWDKSNQNPQIQRFMKSI